MAETEEDKKKKKQQQQRNVEVDKEKKNTKDQNKESNKKEVPNIGDGLYQSLAGASANKGLVDRMGSVFWRGLKWLNPFKSSPKPPDEKINKEGPNSKTGSTSGSNTPDDQHKPGGP